MIPYKYPEEKIVAMTFASLLNDETTKLILTKDLVESKEEAIHLSQFFWRMIEKSFDQGSLQEKLLFKSQDEGCTSVFCSEKFSQLVNNNNLKGIKFSENLTAIF